MWNDRLQTKFIATNAPYWEVTHDLVYTLDLNSVRSKRDRDYLANMVHFGDSLRYKNSNLIITVVTPFTSDLASIHKSVWWFLSPWDIARPSVVHDYLFQKIREHGLDKKIHKRQIKQANLVFKYAMRETQPRLPKYKQAIAYAFVRVLGKYKI